MKYAEILNRVDHTLLSQQARWCEIDALCAEAVEYHTASVCIPPSYIARVRESYPTLNICTVIGFPNGYSTTECKVFETENAIKNGADEVDMVINIGWVKDGLYDLVLDEIGKIKAAAGDKVLKVIIEACLLTEDEKIKMCDIVGRAGADYIKTSTGFSTGGATPEDVKLMREHSPKQVKVKAAGGISTLADAEEFVSLGADRLGSSRVVRLVKEKGDVN